MKSQVIRCVPPGTGTVPLSIMFTLYVRFAESLRGGLGYPVSCPGIAALVFK